jgi:hypothetical protein
MKHLQILQINSWRSIMMISSYELAGQILITPLVMYVQTTYPGHRPIAIRLTINPKTQTIAWGDTSRGHSIQFANYSMNEREITVLSKDGYRWMFVPLTMEIFNRIKGQLVSGNLDFKSDKELQDYYSTANF